MKSETTNTINPKLFKRKILELVYTKRELEAEKNKSLEYQKNTIKPKLETDILKINDIISEYNLSRKTIDRMRERGLKTSQSSPRGTVWIVRKDLEDFLKKDRYGR